MSDVKININDLTASTSLNSADKFVVRQVGDTEDKYATIGNINIEDLENYEDGNFTPTMTGSAGGNAIIAAASGRYTKIGRLVSFSCRMTLSSKNDLSGRIDIGGLPYPVENTLESRTPCSVSLYSGFNLGTGFATILPIAFSNTSKIFLYKGGQTSGSDSLIPADINDNFSIHISGSYKSAV